METNLQRAQQRMQRLMVPIEQQLLMCDTQEDTLLLACAMLERALRLMDGAIGADGTDAIITGTVGDRLSARARTRKTT